MTVETVADADRARDAYVAEQARLRAGQAGRDLGGFDPTDWRNADELARTAAAVEAELAGGLRSLRPPVPVLADDTRERENRADRTAAEKARAPAATHRGQADRIAAGRPDVIEAATVEFFAARDDSTTIAAGPGWFGRKTAKVVQTYDTKPKRRLYDLLAAQGMTANQAVTFITEAATTHASSRSTSTPTPSISSTGSTSPCA